MDHLFVLQRLILPFIYRSRFIDLQSTVLEWTFLRYDDGSVWGWGGVGGGERKGSMGLVKVGRLGSRYELF